MKNTKAKKEVPGWSTEEVKERPNVAVESEMDPCWKKLAERVEEEVLRKSWTSTKSKRAKERPFRGKRCPEEEEMKPQQRMTITKDQTKKIRSKERMDAKSRWWVTKLLAADCDKTWIHTGWEASNCQAPKMERKERAIWLRHVFSWKMSCVNTARKKE